MNMPLVSIILVLGAIQSVVGAEPGQLDGSWRPARQTGRAVNALFVPGPEPTDGPHVRLLARDSTNTCGYVYGYEDFPFVCDSGYICAYNDYNSVYGCCPEDQPLSECYIPTACDGYEMYTDGACESAGPYTGCCTDPSYPFCVELQYPNYFAMLECASVSVDTVVEIYFTPTATGPPSEGTAAGGGEGDVYIFGTVNYNSDSNDNDGNNNNNNNNAGGTGSISSGLDESDKIGLGVGIGFGVPATIGALYALYRQLKKSAEKSAEEKEKKRQQQSAANSGSAGGYYPVHGGERFVN